MDIRADVLGSSSRRREGEWGTAKTKYQYTRPMQIASSIEGGG